MRTAGRSAPGSAAAGPVHGGCMHVVIVAKRCSRADGSRPRWRLDPSCARPGRAPSPRIRAPARPSRVGAQRPGGTNAEIQLTLVLCRVLAAQGGHVLGDAIEVPACRRPDLENVGRCLARGMSIRIALECAELDALRENMRFPTTTSSSFPSRPDTRAAGRVRPPPAAPPAPRRAPPPSASPPAARAPSPSPARALPPDERR